MKSMQLQPGKSLKQALKIQQLDTPKPGIGEVLVRMRAASLNFRDLIVAQGAYVGTQEGKGLVPLSDGAGEVVATGPGTTRWREGDRVVSSFFQDWLDGPFLPAHMQSALGGGIDGVLAEYRVFPETGLARMPAHLSFEQAATLPCAALTAWHALFEKTALLPGETILVLGTGGVSVFALQFARMAGANVIATSSSDEKLNRMAHLGASGLVNYRARPDWDQAVLDLTGGAGVDHGFHAARPDSPRHAFQHCHAANVDALHGQAFCHDGARINAVFDAGESADQADSATGSRRS